MERDSPSGSQLGMAESGYPIPSHSLFILMKVKRCLF